MRLHFWKNAVRHLYLPLRFKFIILFFILITVPFVVSGYVTYTKYTRNVEKNAQAYSMQMADQIRITLDRYVKEIERLTLTPFYDQNVMNILTAHSNPVNKGVYLTTEELSKMNLFISSMAFDRSEIESILIFSNDGSLFSNSEALVKNFWDREGSGWIDLVNKVDGGLAIISPHEVSYYINDAPKTVVSLSRVIREPYTDKKLGIIKVDLNAEGFKNIFSNISFGEDNILIIRNKEGDLVYPEAVNEKHLLQPDPNATHLTAFQISDYTGLSIKVQIPLAELRKEAKDLINSTLLISLISLGFAIAFAILSSNQLVKPIRHLQRKMRIVQKGSFEERAVVTSKDEIGQLTEGFNRMVSDIEQLVVEVYETKLRERDAELSALQSQMNPHFLYNTLETINMLAVQEKNQDISHVVYHLGMLLRYTVDKRQTSVYLQDEMRFMESYLQIQSLRVGNKLHTEIFMDASLETSLVPRLILQPMVENVIEHAMGSSEVTVRVKAWIDEEDLMLSIEDNGLGMDLATMERVRKRMYAKHDRGEEARNGRPGFGGNTHGYALRNVHQRIRLTYGEAYGVSLEQSEERGVRIVIRIPFHWEE